MLDEGQKRKPARQQYRLLERAAFDRICDSATKCWESDKRALLDFLAPKRRRFYANLSPSANE
jgi:hypothetical protein